MPPLNRYVKYVKYSMGPVGFWEAFGAEWIGRRGRIEHAEAWIGDSIVKP